MRAPGWLAPALGCGLLASACAVALVVELYETLAESQRLHDLEHESTARAAELALGLLPWKAGAHRMLALNLAVTRQPDAALAQARAGLRWAPGEAESWRVLARTHALGGGDPGAALTHAVAQARRLAPQSVSLHFSLALDALYGWPYAEEAARALWLRSMRFSLRRDSLRFLRRVALLRRENAFCYYAGAALKRQQWCAHVGRVRADCSRGDLSDGQRAWCDSVGFRRLEPP